MTWTSQPLNGIRRLALAFREAPELDIGLALAAFLSLLLDAELNRADPDLSHGAGVLAAVTCLPLVVRRRYPLGVLAVTVAGVLACLAAFHPDRAAVGVVMACVYTVGLQGRRKRSLLIGAAMAPAVAAAVAVTGDAGFRLAPAVANLALVLTALVAGDARRGRLELLRAAAEETERQREAAAQHQFDEQRLRLTRELHDTVAHALVALNVRAAAAAHLQRGTPGESLDALQEIKRTSADALAELRSTLKMLRPASGGAPLRPQLSLADLPDLVNGLRGAGITVDLRIEEGYEELPPSVAHAGYRIVQEALTNVLRHSGADHALIRVSVIGETVTLEILDNGRALPQYPPTPGQGLKGMAERAASLGGQFEAGIVPGEGWRVRACLPTAGAGR